MLMIDLLVVNKAAGMVVHPGVGNTHGTLIAGLVARFPDMAENRRPAPSGHHPAPRQRHQRADAGGALAVGV